jgi:Ubiquitin carboxyl-terminal hydrolase
VPIAEQDELITTIAAMTKPEKMDQSVCSTCGKEDQRVRQERITQLPRTLILHLIRFMNDDNGRTRKLDHAVKFDEVLHMPCAGGNTKQYRLRSMIQHSGNRHGGHYVTDVKSQGAWYEANDAFVTAVGLARVLESQMYCAAYELMDLAPGTGAHGSTAQPQSMADDTPQEPRSHSRTRKTRPLRPTPGPTAYNLQSYRRRLSGQQWWTTEDVACGRQDARQADELASTQHLPAGLTFPRTANEVTAGFRDIRRDKAAQILRAMLKGQLVPAIISGDGSHWRFICISHAQNIAYLTDPTGPGFFTPAVCRFLAGGL